MTESMRPFARLRRSLPQIGGFFTLRYAAAALGAAKGLLLAKLLGPEGFGFAALAMQLGGLLELAGLGGATGYLKRWFAVGRESDSALAAFPAAAAAWFALAGALALLASPLEPVLFWAALLFLINIPYLALEPALRARGRFAETALPQVVLNLAVILLLLGLYRIVPEPSLGVVLAAIAVGQFCGQLVILPLARRACVRLASPTPSPQPQDQVRGKLSPASGGGGTNAGSPSPPPLSCGGGRGPLRSSGRVGASLLLLSKHRIGRLITTYLGFVRTGFPMFLGGMLYMLLSFVDRLFIARFYPPAALGTYALALQMLLLALLGLQAWSTVATTRIGAALGDAAALRAAVNRALWAALLLGVAGAAGAAAIAFLFERTIYAGYPGLFAATCVAGFGLVGYNAASAAAAVIYFRGRQHALNRALGIALGAGVAMDAALVAAGAGWLALLASTSAIFCGLSLFAVLLARRCVDPIAQPAPPVGGGCSL